MRALVVGGGFVGAACALALKRKGYGVSLIDPGDVEAAASFGNAGHIATEQVDPLASLANVLSLHRRLFLRGGPVGFPLSDMSAWLPFGLKLLAASTFERFAKGQTALRALLAQSLPAWHRIAAHVGRQDLMSEVGHFVAWESESTAKHGSAYWQRANIGTTSFEAASSAELSLLQQRFNSRPVQAIRFQRTGQIMDVQAMRDAMLSRLQGAGGELVRSEVVDLSVNADKASIRLKNDKSFSADLIVIAAGVHSAKLMRETHGSIPLIAERGYHLDLPSSGQTDIPPVAFEDRSVIVTHYQRSVRIAGFTEFSRVLSPADERKWQRLADHAKALGLGPIEQAKRWIGARPTLPDYLPAIGRSPKASNLIYAFGHQHLGVTLAAITGELVADLAQGVTSEIELSAFNLNRFGR